MYLAKSTSLLLNFLFRWFKIRTERDSKVIPMWQEICSVKKQTSVSSLYILENEALKVYVTPHPKFIYLVVAKAGWEPNDSNFISTKRALKI